jgi:hypothetical protein
VLADDEVFLDACQAVEGRKVTPKEVARCYFRQGGLGREVMQAIIESVAAEPKRWQAKVEEGTGLCRMPPRVLMVLRLYSLGLHAVHVEAELETGDRRRWTRENTRHGEAADMLAARGRDQCMASGCGQELKGLPARSYCEVHRRESSHHHRADSDAILYLMKGAARALDLA